MRVIMLSCNTGEGHNSTVKAVREVLDQQGVECDILDVLSCLSETFSKFVCGCHNRIYKYGAKIFDVGYRVAENSETESIDTTFLYELLSFGAGKLANILREGNYDAVLCSHVFAGMMMTEMRKNTASRIPCFYVSTDYTCHPYAGRCELEGYFIPAQDLKIEFLEAGLPEEKLIPTGIPVRQAFYTSGDRVSAREKLGFSVDGKLVLVMGGSLGNGPVESMVHDLMDRLPPNTEVAVICGRNEKLKQNLDEIEDPRISVIGYTTEVSAYMDAADVLLTKPGGLSATEAANKHLPMVFVNSVGGCESRNFNFFLTHGYAVGDREGSSAVDQLLQLLYAPNQLQRIRRNLEADMCMNSAKVIAQHLMEAAKNFS